MKQSNTTHKITVNYIQLNQNIKINFNKPRGLFYMDLNTDTKEYLYMYMYINKLKSIFNEKQPLTISGTSIYRSVQVLAAFGY